MKDGDVRRASLEQQHLFEGQRLSTEAKADFFEEMTSIAFQAGARNQLEILFYALYPPAAQAAQANSIAQSARRRYQFHSKAMAEERMHVTLLPPGRATRLRAPYEVSLERAAASVSFAPFEVRFDRTRGFPTGPDNFCFVMEPDAGSTQSLRALHDKLVHALRMEGIEPLRKGPLQPHLTLLYRTHLCPAVEAIEPIAWRVDGFRLIRSLQGQGKHIVEGEWPARGAT